VPGAALIASPRRPIEGGSVTGKTEASDDASPRWSELLADGIPAKLAVLCLGVWLHAADSMLVATLMPSAVTEIGGVRYIAWTIVLYQVGSIIAGAAGGLAARRLSLRVAMTGAAAISPSAVCSAR